MSNKLAKKEQFSYVGYSFGQTILMAYVLALLSLFYTDVVGLKPSTVALIYLVSRIWDAINDPLMGMMIDRVNLKSGKFKPWLNLTVILLPLTTVLLFLNWDFSYPIKVVYAFFSYILWGMVYTISDVPAFALPTVMTDNVNERNSLLSKRTFGSALAMLIVIPVSALVGTIGWLKLAIIYGVLAFISMIPVISNTTERVKYKRGNDKNSLGETLKYLKSNKYLLIFYTGYLMFSITNTASSMGSYFAKYNLGNLGMASVISGISIIPVFFIPPFLPRLIKKFGKKRILLTAVGFGTILEILLYFIGYDNFTLFIIVSAIKTSGMVMPIIMLGMFTSDCVEYGHYIGGKRSEGITFSVQTFSAKLSSAVSGAMALYLLDFYNFTENQVQQSHTLLGIWKASTLFPAIGHTAFFIIILLFYKLKETDVQHMIEVNKGQGEESELL